MKSVFALTALATALLLSSCAVGPDYEKPAQTAPAQYKAESLGSWKEGRPLDSVPKGDWWTIFGDETLNDLQRRAADTNQVLRAAMARVEQARATARISRSDLFPALSLNPSYTRTRFSENEEGALESFTVDSFRMPLDLSYEIDLWGRIRRGFEGARADAQASLASFHNVLLTLHSDVAQNYFALRAIDAEIATVTATVEWRKEQVRLVRSRSEGGIGNELDVARAETQLATSEAEAASLAQIRTELENAIAILVGENPSSFQLAALPAIKATATSQGTNIAWQPPVVIPWNPTPPEIPAGLPADLLERRPDVSEAERQLAAANARIGVAKAAFFPALSLTAAGGYVSSDVGDLFTWGSRAWSIGPSVSLPIFAGGRNKSNYERSQAVYEESIALFRQQVLVAFGDVENSLANIRHLAEEYAAQERAVVNARRAAELALQRYRFGIVSYFEVVDANREALIAERAYARLAGRRLTATVRLVRALGGGWTEQQLYPALSASTQAGAKP